MKGFLLAHALFSVILDFEISGLKIPSSFSGLRSHSYSTIPTADDLKGLITKFEFDSHVDVVLIGHSFTEETVRSINIALKLLSEIGVSGSPSRFVHEKIVYHVTLGRVLEIPIETTIGNFSLIDHTEIENLLDTHFSSTTKSTTLFVIKTRSQNQNKYSYQDRAFGCSQRSFLSTSGFAWVDLTATAHDLWPSLKGSNILPTIEPNDFLDATNIEALAYLIHRSAEALQPFPLNLDIKNSRIMPSINNNHNNGGYMQHTPHHIFILLITICTSNIKDNCVTDNQSKEAVENLISLYSSAYMNINYVTVTYILEEYPELIHALHSSTQYQILKTNHRKTIKIISQELSHWLQSSDLIKKVISRTIQTTRTSHPGNIVHTIDSTEYLLLPFITIQIPDPYHASLDEDYTFVKSVPLYSPPMLPDEPDVDTNVWPKTAVIFLRLQTLPQAIHTGVSCGNLEEELVSSKETTAEQHQLFAIHSLFFTLREAIWKINHPLEYFSCSGRHRVTDYLWSPPHQLLLPPKSSSRKASAEGDGQLAATSFSFREDRAVSRLIVFSYAQELLERFDSLIEESLQIVPSVNLTSLLIHSDETDSLNNAGREDEASNHNNNKKFDTQFNLESNSDKNLNEQKSILQSFLNAMEKASHEFSHLEFEIAVHHFKIAERILTRIENKFYDLTSQRRGGVFCSDPSGEGGEEENTGAGSRKYIYRLLLLFFLIIVVVGSAIVYISPNILAFNNTRNSRIHRNSKRHHHVAI